MTVMRRVPSYEYVSRLVVKENVLAPDCQDHMALV